MTITLGRLDPRPLFYFAPERELIRIKREAGEPPPWTDDAVLRDHQFCNTRRENDRVTRWFRDHVREPMRDDRDVLFAIVWFRCWCNQPDAAEVVFAHGDNSPFAEFVRTRDGGVIGEALKAYGAGGKDRPLFGAAYKIMGAPGYKSKLEGTTVLFQRFINRFDWRDWPNDASIESACRYLETFDGVGSFLAFQVTCDLRHTALLDQAPDKLTFAVAGPGAIRGLNRMHGRDKETKICRQQSVDEMRELLALSQSNELWSGEPFELAEIQHLCCETDKLMRYRAGQGGHGRRFGAGGAIGKKRAGGEPENSTAPEELIMVKFEPIETAAETSAETAAEAPIPQKMNAKSIAKQIEDAKAAEAPAADPLNRNPETEAFDPFDLSNLVVPQSFAETAGVHKLLTTIPCRKPSPQDFVRVHPNPVYRHTLTLIELKDDREVFLVDAPRAPASPVKLVCGLSIGRLIGRGSLSFGRCQCQTRTVASWNGIDRWQRPPSSP
jgi:alpha-glutamyl/putrescinyl thymine pyrophosphorylase clade 1